MKRSKFTDTQIMDTLKRGDAGLAVPEVCRELGPICAGKVLDLNVSQHQGFHIRANALWTRATNYG